MNSGFQFGAGIATFRAVENLLSGIASAATNAAIESVKVSAEYEKTRKSLEVFTGSARLANAELAEVSELARNTQGLSLPDAEKGTLRLRALGFEAKTARDLVAGIAKNKVLSGSDEQAVNRVIQNLEQLRAGSPQVKKDVQQMVLAIPTLSKVINESFGSVEKFQAALRKNPDEALTKFAEAAKNTQVGNAGLSDSIIKLQNEFLTAQRLFGEPLLEPVTEGVKSLTKYLEENKEVWRGWGNYVADIIAGINAPDASSIPKPPEYNTLPELDEAYNSGKIGFWKYATRGTSLTIRDLDQMTRQFGEPDAISTYLNEKQKVGQDQRILREGSKRLRPDGTIDFSEFSGGKTQKEIEADNKAIADKAKEDRERVRQQELTSIKRNADAVAAISKNRYETEQSLLDVNIRYTDQQEAAYIQRSAQIKQSFYAAERSRIESYYGKVISLSEAGSDEALKAEADKQKELANLNTQEVSEAYKTQRQILELERKIQDERRQNNIKFNQIQANESQQTGAKQLFELQRNLDKGNVDYRDFYNQQVSIANDSLKTLLELNRKNLDLELQDKTLTFEQIRNLRRESALEDQRLTQENAERLYQIEKDSVERQKDLISTFAEFRSNIIASASDIQGGFADLFFGKGSTGGQSRTAVNALLDGYREGFNGLSQEIEKYRQKAHAEDARLRTLSKNKSVVSTQTSDISSEIQKAQSDLKSLEDNLKMLTQGVSGFEQGGRFALDVASGKLFDTITKKLVENKMNNGEAIAALDSQIAEQKTLLSKLQANQQTFSEVITTDAEQTDNGFWSIVKQLEGDLKSLERYKDLLNNAVKTFDSFKATPEGVDRLQMRFLKNKNKAEIGSLNTQIEAQKNIVNGSEGVEKLKERLKLTELQQRAEATKIRQLADEEEAYRKTIGGLTAYNQALREGDAQAVAFVRNGARKSILEEQGALLEQNIVLQERINAVGEDASERFKNAWLTAILAVKEANIQAVESQIQSQVKLADSATLHTDQVRARVLEHLAEQKTLSESFADGIIGAFDKVTNLLDKNLGKLGDVPILGDLLKFGNRQITTDLTKNLLDKFFPSEFTELFNKEKNPIAAPIVEQLKTTNKLLSTGLGGAASSGGGSIIQKLLGAFGIGGGSGNITSGQIFGSGQNPNNPLIFHANSNGQLPTNGNPLDLLRFLTPQQNLPRPDGLPIPKSNGAGVYGMIGTGASLLGNVVGGRFGGLLSGAGQGLALGAQIGSIVPGIGTAIGAGVGAAVGFFTSLFGGDKNKKQDKKENMPALQKAFSDAFAEYRQLITDVRALRAEPDGALSKGDELRSQIASGFGIQFLSKKYKKESQNLIKAQLQEIDKRPSGLREQLETAVEMAKSANERANRLLPEFADGGMVSGFTKTSVGSGFFSGLVPGTYDRKDDKLIKVSGREVVLTPDQWMPITPYLQSKKVPGFADGGYVGQQSVSTPVNNFTLELHNVNLTPDSMAYLRTNDGERRVIEIMKKAGGNGQFVKGDIKQS